jgi:hypothetical protein
MSIQATFRVCPYNAKHKIKNDKFLSHLVKCSKSFPPGFLETCYYNICHRVPKGQLPVHHQLCEDRKAFDAKVSQPANYIRPENTNKLGQAEKVDGTLHPDFAYWNPPASSNPFQFDPKKVEKASFLKCNKI